ncbi:BatA and WFA domain-containing protein [Psychrobacillus sp. FSL W7-1493]|uniref:vWA domain-containing protein n=1 Tax=Psychrobacillus sp. FSL W7-1493 TaxID=2921552 RepID=UPI0030F88CB7
MGFSQLPYLWTAIFPVVVLLYYFFRKKYKKQSVSSTLFWEEVMKETRASPYLQHLQKNALFYLQMLAMILLVLALIQPYWKKEALAGEQVIFVLDTSASMEVNINNANLFDLHKQEMLDMIEQLSGKPFTLITTGNEPTAVLKQETNINHIKNEINKLEVTYDDEAFSKTLDFAQSFFQTKDTSVYVFTDMLDRQTLPLHYENVSWNVIGQPVEVDNISIKRFGATKMKNGTSALVQIDNQTNEEQNVSLKVSNGEKDVIKEAVILPPRETVTLSFNELEEASFLKATIDVSDDYLLDNEMVVFMQDQLSKIYIDSSLHTLVRTAFQSLGIEMSSIPSEQVSLVKEEGILATNQFGLINQMERPALFIGRNDVTPIEVNGNVQTVEHPLFSFADLSDIYVSSVYPGVDGYSTIATVDNKPFIQVSPKGDVVVLSDIQMTDWPLSPSFPLFMWSVKEQLSNSNLYLGTFTPNERKPQSLGSTTNEWEIYTMEDSYLYSIENGGAFMAPKEPGVYVIRSGEKEKYFTVALSQKEKEISKGASYSIGAQKTDKQSENHEQFSLVPFLIVVLLLLFVIEWEVQRRRGFTS